LSLAWVKFQAKVGEGCACSRQDLGGELWRDHHNHVVEVRENAHVSGRQAQTNREVAELVFKCAEPGAHAASEKQGRQWVSLVHAASCS
jgi:hypothetical protein